MDTASEPICISGSFPQHFATLVGLQHLPQHRGVFVVYIYIFCKEKSRRCFCFMSFTNSPHASQIRKKQTTRELGEGNLSERQSHPHGCSTGRGTAHAPDAVRRKALAPNLTSVFCERQRFQLGGIFDTTARLRKVTTGQAYRLNRWPAQANRQHCQAENYSEHAQASPLLLFLNKSAAELLAEQHGLPHLACHQAIPSEQRTYPSRVPELRASCFLREQCVKPV